MKNCWNKKEEEKVHGFLVLEVHYLYQYREKVESESMFFFGGGGKRSGEKQEWKKEEDNERRWEGKEGRGKEQERVSGWEGEREVRG